MRLPGRACRGRQKGQNKVSVCREQPVAADKKGKTSCPSAGNSLSRQTKRTKQAVRLPGTASGGRQKGQNKLSVCREQPAAADKKSKTSCPSAGFSHPRQTKRAKQENVCLSHKSISAGVAGCRCLGYHSKYPVFQAKILHTLP